MSPGAASLTVIVIAAFVAGSALGAFVTWRIILLMLGTKEGLESMLHTIAKVLAEKRAARGGGEVPRLRCPCDGKGFF